METIRIILICLHVLITFILLNTLRPYLSYIASGYKYRKDISLVFGFVSHLLRILLYHVSCIIVIWYDRWYGAGVLRATGILLIGEFLHFCAVVIREAVQIDHTSIKDLVFAIINVLVHIAAIIITFRLAMKISKHKKDSMRFELLTTTDC
jgi:hypothetical protein